MKSLVLGLAVFCLAFETGVFAKEALFGRGMACFVPIEVSRVRWQEDISETVFRYEIEHFTPVNTVVYYLSIANDSDPSKSTLESLKSSQLPIRRLSELGTYPRTNSHCYYCPTGETEFILRIGKIRWLTDDEALVGGSLRRWVGNVDQAFLFHVVRKGRSWAVKEHEIL